MKKISLLLAVLLVLSLVLCACGGNDSSYDADDSYDSYDSYEDDIPAEDPEEEAPAEFVPGEPLPIAGYDWSRNAVSVEMIGSFDCPEAMQFTPNMLLMAVDGNDTYAIYDPLGRALFGGKGFSTYEYFGNGIASLGVNSDEAPKCSLVNLHSGEVYLEDAGCSVNRISDRFYWVIFATEQTTEESEAIIYFTDRSFSIAPQEGDTLYKGYAKIYDLALGSYVGDLSFGKDQPDVEAADGCLVINEDWSASDVYVDGVLVGEGVEPVTVCGDRLIQETDNGLCVYDTSFQLLNVLPDGWAISENSDQGFEFSNKFLSVYDYDLGLEGVWDINGNETMAPKFDYVASTFYDYVISTMEQDEESTYGVYLADGTELLPCEYEYAYGDDELPVIHLSTFDDSYQIYIPGCGKILESSLYQEDGGIFYTIPNEEDYYTRSYVVYTTGEEKTYTGAKALGNALLWCDDGLVEMVGGTALMGPDTFAYDSVVATDAHLYCYTAADNTITVYQVNGWQ